MPTFLPIYQVIVVLHGDELVPPIAFCYVLKFLEFPGSHAGCSNVPDFARLHHIVQGTHYLLARNASVEPVDLENVDICTKARYTFIDSVNDMLAAKANLIEQVAIVDG
jgi:hypothetical protein